MTRRDALVGLTAVVAAHVGTVEAQQGAVTMTPWRQTRGMLSFALDGYTNYVFTLGDRRVEVTPEEIMDALDDPRQALVDEVIRRGTLTVTGTVVK